MKVLDENLEHKVRLARKGDRERFTSLIRYYETSLYRMAKTILKKGQNFKLSDYNEVVLRSGLFEGKRLFIPIAYDIPAFWSTQSTILRNKIASHTLYELANSVRVYKQENPDKYFFGYSAFDKSDSAIKNIIYANWVDFVDYNEKTADFDSSEFVV